MRKPLPDLLARLSPLSLSLGLSIPISVSVSVSVCLPLDVYLRDCMDHPANLKWAVVGAKKEPALISPSIAIIQEGRPAEGRSSAWSPLRRQGATH